MRTAKTIKEQELAQKNTAEKLDTPASYKEWSLAGGQAGTGKTYAEYLGKTNDAANSTIGSMLGLDTKTTADFNADFEQQYNAVMNGSYGVTNAREKAGNALAAKYPGLKDKIWAIIWGKPLPGNEGYVVIPFPDGYEKDIKQDTNNDITNPFK